MGLSDYYILLITLLTKSHEPLSIRPEPRHWGVIEKKRLVFLQCRLVGSLRPDIGPQKSSARAVTLPLGGVGLKDFGTTPINKP